MEIITELAKQKYANSQSDQLRMFKGIRVGKYHLSIQASLWHYCIPRRTLTVDKYSSMELGIFKVNRSGLLNIKRSNVIKNFSRYSELLNTASGGKDHPVYAFVPVDLINDLYLYLKSI